MARQGIWVHGNVFQVRYPGGKGDPVWGNHTDGRALDGVNDAVTRGRVEWSDIVGLRTDTGVSFTGRTNQRNVFYASIPTPSWRDGVRAAVAMIGFLFTSDDPVTITGGRVFDAYNHLLDLPVMSISGRHPDLIENVTRFDFGQPAQVFFGLSLALDVLFAQEGTITFHTAGADFLVS